MVSAQSTRGAAGAAVSSAQQEGRAQLGLWLLDASTGVMTDVQAWAEEAAHSRIK